ncbi:MAG: adenosine deaminase, partial [Chloroflexi bacterium]|nr:adenosine deaminase [Chloroflexota bacterium]
MNSTQHIPKAEIHVHLEATINPDLCRKFAKRNNVKISDDIFGSQYAYAWDDFYDFIKKYDIVTSVIQTPEDYRELTYNYLKECAESNVIYVEAMISSTHAKLRGMTYHSFLEGVVEGAKEAKDEFGIVSKFIMNGIRHLGPESVEKTAREVLNNPHSDLVGFGLAGDELHF